MIDARELVLDQVTTVLRNDFEIFENNEVVGRITTEGGLGSRLFMGNREFLVTELDGTPVARLVDVVDFGRDTYELHDASGGLLGTCAGRSPSSASASPSCPPTPGTGWRSTATSGATTTRSSCGTSRWPGAQKWAGLGRALLGGQRYAVSLTHTTDARLRQVILGVVIAIDLMKAKDERSASSSGSS